jgi:hypothetical protein
MIIRSMACSLRCKLQPSRRTDVFIAALEEAFPGVVPKVPAWPLRFMLVGRPYGVAIAFRKHVPVHAADLGTRPLTFFCERTYSGRSAASMGPELRRFHVCDTPLPDAEQTVDRKPLRFTDILLLNL